MAQFCTSCGTQIAEGTRFCTGCGALQNQAGVPAAAAAPAPAPIPPAAKSSSALKVILVVVGIFFLMGALALVSVIYTAYRVKHRVEAAAREQGVDLGALTASRSVSGRLPDPCSLLSTSEASDILALKVVSAESSGNTCTYHTATLNAEEQQDKIAQAMKELDAKGADAEKDPSKALEGITKAFGGAMAGGAGGFSVELNRDGRQALNAMRLALGMAGGKGLTKKIEGLGDDAQMGPMGSMLMFRKGDLGVQIDGRMITGQEKLTAMAQKIASRL